MNSGHDRGEFQKSLATLESLVPGFAPDLDALKEADWVELIGDANAVARKIITLKTYFPTLDVVDVMARKPKVFLHSEAHLKTVSEQVRHGKCRVQELPSVFWTDCLTLQLGVCTGVTPAIGSKRSRGDHLRHTRSAGPRHGCFRPRFVPTLVPERGSCGGAVSALLGCRCMAHYLHAVACKC